MKTAWWSANPFNEALMADELRSLIKHHLVLHRPDLEQGVARFYSLMIERDLFGRVVLVQNWERIGAKGAS